MIKRALVGCAVLFFGLMILGVVIQVLDPEWVERRQRERKAQAPPPPPPPPVTLSTPKADGITMAKFLKVEEGMTYDEVVKVIGAPGVLQGSSVFADVKTENYYWSPVGFVKLGGMVGTFDNGRLTGKTQVGLR